MITTYVNRLLRDQRGATAIEYGLICALISMAALGAMRVFANESVTMWMTVAGKVLAGTA